MPYRRLPKTDTARLKALKTLLDNNDTYTVRERFIDWKTINKAQPAYDKLLTASEQYKVNLKAQTRFTGKIDKLQKNAMMYLSHFLQVLFLAVERGEIKRSCLTLYGLDEEASAVPHLKTIDGLLDWGQKIIAGEKARLKQGGRPSYNPTIGMVSTHYDIYCEAIERQRLLQDRVNDSIEKLRLLRPAVDEVILDLWNQIEHHFVNEPPETRFNHCREYGIVYYYRRHEPHIY